MAQPAILRKLTTILAADAVGYSRLMGADERHTVEILAKCRKVTDALISEKRGTIIGTAGDSVLAEYPSVVDAVECAVQIQKAIESLNDKVPEARRMRFRIGINLGDVIIDDNTNTMHGDGINVAVRLESIAEAGGILISRAVHEQVFNKLPYGFQDIGEKELKNIAYRVRVYRVLQLDSASSNPTAVLPALSPAAVSKPVPGFKGRPAIAVLPFSNFSSDPDQEYLVDGITEDIITELANWRVFPVIARNSTFTYKGKNVDIQQVGKELGVQYVVEGSVRKLGQRLRVVAQLIDATTGHHVLAEKYDRNLTDLFELQDEIVSTVVGAIEPELLKAERERVTHASQQELNSYDCFMRGLACHYRYTQTDNAEAQRLFRKAVEIDPGNVNAHSHFTLAMLFAVQSGWRLDDEHNFSVASELGRRAVALDPRDPIARFVLGSALMFAGHIEEALAETKEAIRLNPSLAAAHATLAYLLNFVGHPQEALTAAAKAIRLSPHDPRLALWLPALAAAHFHLHQYQEAIAAGRRALALRPGHPVALRYVVASLGELGRINEAEQERAALLSRFRSVAELSASIRPYYRDDVKLEQLLDGLRKAGMA